MLCLVFAMSLLDRTNISSAYIAGLETDLRLDIGARYSIALLVFFIGYAVFELPSNFIIRKVGARLWMGFLILAWGAVVLGMGFVDSWVTLTICRALLGIFEAGGKPSQSQFLSMKAETNTPQSFPAPSSSSHPGTNNTKLPPASPSSTCPPCSPPHSVPSLPTPSP